jgi:hypothetical protein
VDRIVNSPGLIIELHRKRLKKRIMQFFMKFLQISDFFGESLFFPLGRDSNGKAVARPASFRAVWGRSVGFHLTHKSRSRCFTSTRSPSCSNSSSANYSSENLHAPREGGA